MKKKIFDPRFECIWIALIVTLLLASTFDQYTYKYDQFRNLIVSDEILERGIPTYFEYNFYKHPPLLFYMISFVSLSGISLYTAGQIVVLLFAFLSVVFAYKLGKELFNQNFARVSSVILGVTPSFWMWGNRIMHETMIYFFFLSSLYFLLMGIRKGKTRYWLAFGLLLGLGLLAKVVILLIIPIAFVFFILSPKVIRVYRKLSYVNLDLAKKAILSLLIAFLVYSPYLLYKIVNKGPDIIRIWVEHIRGDLPWASEIVSMPFYHYIPNLHGTLSIAVTLLFAIGLVFMTIRRERKLLLPLVWFLVVIVFFSLPAYKEARLINALLPASIFIGVYGLFELSKVLGKLGNVKPGKIILSVSILVVAVQMFSSLSIVTNDGHWPSDWAMWGYLKGMENGGVIVSDYDYTAIRYFTGSYSDPLLWGSMDHDILDGMMRSSVYYIYTDETNVSEEHFQKVREFEECNCSLYRIREKFLENVTLLKVYSGGKPMEGVRISVHNQKAEKTYMARSNRNGEAFLPLTDGYYRVSGEKICYEENVGYIEIRDRKTYECELISKLSIPFVVECSDNEYIMNLGYKSCFNHEFIETRF